MNRSEKSLESRKTRKDGAMKPRQDLLKTRNILSATILTVLAFNFMVIPPSPAHAEPLTVMYDYSYNPLTYNQKEITCNLTKYLHGVAFPVASSSITVKYNEMSREHLSVPLEKAYGDVIFTEEYTNYTKTNISLAYSFLIPSYQPLSFINSTYRYYSSHYNVTELEVFKSAPLLKITITEGNFTVILRFLLSFPVL